MKPRRLEQTKPFHEPVQGPISHPSSIVDVYTYIRNKTYSFVIKRRHVDNVDWEDVGQGLRNLRTALERDSQTTYRMANSGDFLGSLLNAKIGDAVYAFKEIRDGKFDSLFTWPYTVAGFTQNNNVNLETEDSDRIMKHKDKLLLVHC